MLDQTQRLVSSSTHALFAVTRSDKEDRDDALFLVGTNKVEDLAALMAQLEESEEED